ncbi:UDP-glycosyltransferase 82A1-like [Phragmites australis]|uniref:UDP-glycosyltransferase 82A1-like n=1 Tax=Phragmites australis TaxID=29695 RepID=UPI002D788751|nr:UDP-glycosyltransferase 82A1-like [Phragmites australis]
MGAEAAMIQTAVLLVPFPAQGHVTPMLHLARALAAHGAAATVAVPDFIHRRIAGIVEGGDGVELASIPSGITEGSGAGNDETPGFGAIAQAMEHHMPAHLERMLTRRRPAVACVVVDVLASWAIPVAARCGVPATGFWPAMLASYRVVAAIPELMEKGLISESGTPISPSNQSDNEQIIQDQMIRGLKILPAQVELRTKELPWLVGDSVTQKSRFAFWLQTLHRARSFRAVLVNSFPDEAGEDVGHLSKQSPRILPVGPALLPGLGSSAERTKGSTDAVASPQPCSNKNPSMWRADSSCIGWLDAQRAGSVVYVSFGSWVGPIGPDKIRELALGLEATGRPFLWALKRDPSWRAGLPDGFAERIAAAGRGKVVDWAPQEDVLRHRAVGCYLTHCGWNSTLEAVQHGVRLLCYPVSGDQFINCAYITGLWEIGLKLGSMSRDDVKDRIARIMEGDDGRRLQENVRLLREKVVTTEARRSADRNVRSFVDEIKKDQPLLMQIYSVL